MKVDQKKGRRILLPLTECVFTLIHIMYTCCGLDEKTGGKANQQPAAPEKMGSNNPNVFIFAQSALKEKFKPKNYKK